MDKKKLYIALIVFVISILVSFIDGVIKPNYFTKIPIKIIFFLIIPLIFFWIHKEEFDNFKQLFKLKKKGIFKALLIGITIFIVILLGYYFTQDIIDYSNVTLSLTKNMGVNANNFLYVSLYISFFNSFLEEFFFRGFGFITLKKNSSRKFAYIFSSLMFAVYHIGMLIEMFDIAALLLLFVGLVIGGCIFNYLNEKNDTIYPSWFVHMFANFAINTVGFILFGTI